MQDSHSVAALFGALTVVLIVIAIMIIPAVFYVLTLQKALNRCSPECRAMNPPMVWLLFIPLFNVIWHFMVVMNLAKSLGAEFQISEIPDEFLEQARDYREKVVEMACEEDDLLMQKYLDGEPLGEAGVEAAAEEGRLVARGDDEGDPHRTAV